MPTAGKAGKYAKAEETNMAETVNQEANGAASAAQTTPAAQPGVKTFTQAELDAIVADRLARERAKYPDYESIKAKAAKYDAAEEAGKSELQKANERAAALKTELESLKKANQLRELRASVAKEKGVPEALLTGETEEACKGRTHNKNREALKNNASRDLAEKSGFEFVRGKYLSNNLRLHEFI